MDPSHVLQNSDLGLLRDLSHLDFEVKSEFSK